MCVFVLTLFLFKKMSSLAFVHVSEWLNDFIPKKVSFGSLLNDHFSSPDNISNFLFLKFDVSIENCILSSLIPSQLISSTFLFIHEIIDGFGISPVIILIFIWIWDVSQDILIVINALDSISEDIQRLALLQSLFAIWVEVSHSWAELVSLQLNVHLRSSRSQRVVHNLDGSEVGFEVEQILQHLAGSWVQLGGAVFVEFFEPHSFKGGSDLFRGVLFQSLFDIFHVSVLTGLFDESCEVWTDRRVDQDVSVELSVLLVFQNGDVLHFVEVSQWVGFGF